MSPAATGVGLLKKTMMVDINQQNLKNPMKKIGEAPKKILVFFTASHSPTINGIQMDL